ncbi:MAG: hypothetical protein DMG98_22755 [Acidobacteria bacterium]|nr:MAG: hypothetical protein DMG98_22755 [Acidobacteriota bacterium]
MVDLNTLIPPPDSGMQLFGAQNINERGEISGLGFLPESGEIQGFLLIPCGVSTEDCGDQPQNAATELNERPRVLPTNIFKMLRQRQSHPYHVPSRRCAKGLVCCKDTRIKPVWTTGFRPLSFAPA